MRCPNCKNRSADRVMPHEPLCHCPDCGHEFWRKGGNQKARERGMDAANKRAQNAEDDNLPSPFGEDEVRHYGQRLADAEEMCRDWDDGAD